MPKYRFKTEEEFIKEFGPDWRTEHTTLFTEEMDIFFGQEYPDEFLPKLYDYQFFPHLGGFTIRPYMLTEIKPEETMNEEKKELRFIDCVKVGQTVYSVKYGEGIIQNKPKSGVPILVLFKDHKTTYDHNGYDCGDYLYLEPVQLPERRLFLPDLEFEEEEMVWVKNDSSSWHVRFYSHKDESVHFVFANQKKSGRTIPVTEIRKFTDNPLL